ncbi:hypothetical protein IWX50DRAFT_631040 [Phyllosticta citricarpa]|uniref:Secreted protein n=1 Tax=Phyllosticta citricarpa TaxID=55181 RepID=A0ABR1M1H9_9PEZI
MAATLLSSCALCFLPQSRCLNGLGDWVLALKIWTSLLHFRDDGRLKSFDFVTACFLPHLHLRRSARACRPCQAPDHSFVQGKACPLCIGVPSAKVADDWLAGWMRRSQMSRCFAHHC